MVFPIDDHLNGGEALISDIRLSTVVPASITVEDTTHEFTDMDLALKLHYITTVHFYGAEAAAGLKIHDFKKPMFQWLQLYYPVCGRIRRHDDGGGRPFVKCNDSGVRIVEARCTKTVAEWLATVNGGDHHRLLVYRQPIVARDFGYTPLVFLQLTKFKCGGLCVGMSWAHFLGDAFSASDFINMWGKIMANQTPPRHPGLETTRPIIIDQHGTHPASTPSCGSLKPLDPVGDNWFTPNNLKMQAHTFILTQKHLNNLCSEERKKKYKVGNFEVISAIIWKTLAKIKEAKIVNVVKKRELEFELDHASLGNVHQAVGSVEAEETSLVRDGDPLDLAKMISEKFVDETGTMEKLGGQSGNLDFIVYGSNLTFVNLEGLDLNGLRLNGHGPVFANTSIGGAGDEGAVVVVPNGDGRIVNVILGEEQLQHLKNELRVEWGIF